MNDDYKTLLRVILDICLIKKGPKDIPESIGLLKVAFFTYFVSGTLLLANDVSWFDAAIQALIEALLLGAFVYGVVRFFSLERRFSQSMTAIYASGTLITTLSVPYVFMVASLSKHKELKNIAGIVVFWILCWSLIVMTNVIRETIEKKLWISLLLTFCYMYLSHLVISFVYPVNVL